MDRNFIDQLDCNYLGNLVTGGTFDIVGQDNNASVTGAGGVVLGLFTAGTFSANATVTLRESADGTTWRNVRANNLTWKPYASGGEPGEYEAASPELNLGTVYGTTASANRITLVQYNGARRYIRLETANVNGGDVVGHFAVTRRKYRGDAVGGV